MGPSSSSLVLYSRGTKYRSFALPTEVEASFKATLEGLVYLARPPLETCAVVKACGLGPSATPLPAFVIQGVWNHFFQPGQNNLVDIKGGEGALPQRG